MRISTLLLVVLSISGLNVSLAQTSDDKLTSTEELEVRRYVESFSRRLRVTRDLTPFLNEPVAKGVIEQVSADSDMNMIAPRVVSKVRREELSRFYIAMTNVAYLSEVYVYSTTVPKAEYTYDLPLRRQYPSQVFRLLKNNQTVVRWRQNSDVRVATVRQLRQVTATLEKAAALMRRYFKLHPPERSDKYKTYVSRLAPYLKNIKVENCKSDKDCAGFPLHTQFITVPVPVLELHLVRLNNEIQIMIIGLLSN